MTTGITNYSGGLNSLGSIKDSLVKSQNTIAEVVARGALNTLDVFAAMDCRTGRETGQCSPAPVLGVVQIAVGGLMLFNSCSEEPLNKMSLLKSIGDMVTGVGVIAGNLPVTISGIALGAIGKTFEIMNK